MAYSTKNPQLRGMYEKMLVLAADTSSELYHEGKQRSGAGHRAAFWDGYNGVHPSPQVIPGTLSSACAAAGRDFRKRQDKANADPVERHDGYPKRGRPVTTGTTPAKTRTAKTRADLAQAGGKRLDVYLSAQGAADLVECMGRFGMTQKEAVHKALAALAQFPYRGPRT